MQRGRRTESEAAAPNAEANGGPPPRPVWPWPLSDRGILAIACGVAAVGVAAFVSMWMIANGTFGSNRATLQINAIKYGLGFFAASGAVAALLLSIRRQQLSEHAHDLELRKQTHTETDTAERRVTELYTKAVEQLGHADAAVRLGGLYALERVAQNSVEQRQTVVNVICAYLRMPYDLPSQNGPTESKEAADPDKSTRSDRNLQQELQVRMAAQSILAEHLRRPQGIDQDGVADVVADPKERFWPSIAINLNRATLVGLDLQRCAVRAAQFKGATFHGSTEFGDSTFLELATFGYATFLGTAGFSGAAFLGEARFGGVRFAEDVGFNNTKFSDQASFGAVTFAGAAMFRKARFSGSAWFAKAAFSDWCLFGEAAFSGSAYFGEARFGPLPRSPQ